MKEQIKMDLVIDGLDSKNAFCNNVKYIIMNRPLSSLKVGDRLKGIWIPDSFQDKDDPSRLVNVNKYVVTAVIPAVTPTQTAQAATIGKGNKGKGGDQEAF